MPRHRFAPLLAPALIALALSLAGCGPEPAAHVPYRLSAADKALFRPGDIIMRKGEGVLSQLVCSRLGDTLQISHCGILVKSDSTWLVIHALSKEVSDADGVQCATLDSFTAESIEHTIRVVRFRGDSTQLMARRAWHYLRRPKPFDHLFSLRDTGSFFCSELPLHILKQSFHTELVPPDSCPRFSRFLDPAYFDTVFPHGE